METSNKNAKTIAIIAGAAITAVGLLLLLRRSAKKPSSAKVNQSTIVRTPLTEAERAAVIKQINLTYDNNRLTPEAVIAIVEATQKIGAPDYVNLTWEARNLRRENKDNLKEYARICEDHVKKVQFVTEQNESEILNHVGIPKATWDQTTAFYLSQQNAKLLNFQSSLAEKQVAEMGSRKDLTLQEFKRVLERHTELLRSEKAAIPQVMQSLTRPENVLTVIQERINDKIAEEFGVEDEDFVSAMEKYNNENDCQMLIQNFLHAAMNLGA